MYSLTQQRQPSPQNGKLSRYITRSPLLSANACSRTKLLSQVHQEPDALVDTILKHTPLLKRLRFECEDGQPQCVHVLNLSTQEFEAYGAKTMKSETIGTMTGKWIWTYRIFNPNPNQNEVQVRVTSSPTYPAELNAVEC